MKNKILTLFILCLSICIGIHAQSKRLTINEIKLEKDGYVDIQTLDKSIVIDLKYATADNFTKVVLYDSIHHAYLHPLAAKKLVKAQQYLKQLYPDYSIIVYDAARPLTVQRKMYNGVKGTSQQSYVANPDRTGLHNYGMAVDLSIIDAKGKPLDMGTIFDFLGSAAGINNEPALVTQGVLTNKHVENRKLLRKVMTYAGFLTIRGEWWHFNAVSLSEAKKNYKVIP